MDTTIKFNPDLGNIAISAFLIEKVHRCDDCPIRKMGMKHPHSIFARLHAWHAAWWPAWKAYQARVRTLNAMAKTQA